MTIGKIPAIALFAFAAGCAGIGFFGDGERAVPDEPDEINLDSLGGTLVTFGRFVEYCEANPGFKAQLLECAPVDESMDEFETVWLKPGDIKDGATVCDWGIGDIEGTSVLCTYGGHGGGCVRRAVEIPADGFYRVWARYYHTQGQIASFALSLEDGRLAEETDLSLTIPQNACGYRFDFAEHGRRAPLPNYIDDPTGFKWESAPLVWLEKGKKSLFVSGTVHSGPFGGRAISDIVITREPLDIPEKTFEGVCGAVVPGAKYEELKELWLRRPRLGKGGKKINALWWKWQKDYMAFLASGKAEGVEEKRIAETVYFDRESNLIGTPSQVAAEKENIARFIDSIDRVHFKVRFEANEFTVDKHDDFGSWYVEGSGLGAGWWGGEASAYRDFAAPSGGVYKVWLKHSEIAGYLAPFTLSVEDMQGNTLDSLELCADEEINAKGGSIWRSVSAKTEDGRFRIRITKTAGGRTYRHVQACIVSDDPDFVPVFDEQAIPPFDAERPLTVWRADPWAGFTRTSFPKNGQNLDPATIDLREGEAETVLLLVRNNTAEAKDITPRITGGAADLVSWRLPAFVYSATDVFGWVPMPLLAREEAFVPAWQTAGIWLTIRGKDGFAASKATVEIGGECFELSVNRLEKWGGGVPVPYVFAWTGPFASLSSWELFRELGINVIGDPLVPKAEAEKYGMKLVVHLNDGDVSTNHVEYLHKRYERMGYTTKDWAWSFMDEPGDWAVDYWENLAKQLREFDNDVRLWVNPGETSTVSPEAAMRMSSYVDVYCPYSNHFATQNEDYKKRLLRQDEKKFDILLGYTTPDVGAMEKSPDSPYSMVGMANFALENNLDGWAFFALVCGYQYCNSLWDEVNQFSSDQAVSMYPGAQWHTISSRFAEGIREAVQIWRRAKAAPPPENM
ncbi:MAG: hypothetical protein ILO34_01610 [Kiritimatiellae bacterium]|nr:hypothetical protein [Kiritimatiellia bacterium]